MGQAPTFSLVVQEHGDQSCGRRERKPKWNLLIKVLCVKVKLYILVNSNILSEELSHASLQRPCWLEIVIPRHLGDARPNIFIRWSTELKNLVQLFMLKQCRIQSKRVYKQKWNDQENWAISKEERLTSFFPGKIGFACKSSANMQPTDHMSIAGPYFVAPSSNSGGLPRYV